MDRVPSAFFIFADWSSLRPRFLSAVLALARDRGLIAPDMISLRPARESLPLDHHTGHLSLPVAHASIAPLLISHPVSESVRSPPDDAACVAAFLRARVVSAVLFLPSLPLFPTVIARLRFPLMYDLRPLISELR